MRKENMNNDLEMELHLREMFGPRDTDERSCAESIQRITDALDAFFERLDVEKYLGHNSREVNKTVVERLGNEPNRDQAALNELHTFAKAEKQRVPTMTSREIRHSLISVLRKAADAMATT
jgi:hypothetical protein